MAKGNSIVISQEPRGRFMEGIVNGALYPGVCVQIDVSEGLDGGGRPTWELYNADADGNQRLVAVLCENWTIGAAATAAYTSGDRGYVYIPLPGDELNMLVSNLAGTADDHTFGQIMIIDDGTGELIDTTSSPESEPFILLEAITDPTADTLAHCLFTGY